MKTALVFNRQRTRKLNGRMARQIALHLLTEEFKAAEFEIGFHFVEPEEMARVNETHLQHEGSTDVITFQYGPWHGEIFICVADAMAYAKQFKCSWQTEVARYIAHGLLHIAGYDDLRPELKRAMKRQENRIVKELSQRFDLRKLGSNA